MFCSKDRILRRARTFHRPGTACADDSVPPVPPLPSDLPAAAAPMAIPMPLPPTARPTESLFHSQLPLTQSHHHHFHQSLSSNKISHFPSQDFARHVSSCSSHASSSWSSASSTTSASSVASSSPPAPRCFGSTFNPLRMHPPAKTAGLGFADDGMLQSSTVVAPTSSSHGFNFGFDKGITSSSSTSASRHSDRLPTTSFFDDDSSDEEPFDDDDDDDDYVYGASAANADESAEFATVLSPPPHYRRLRAPQSEANLSASAAGSLPPSPVRLRPQSGASDADHYIKRGDWKRRGIVFSAQEA